MFLISLLIRRALTTSPPPAVPQFATATIAPAAH
jgi:hypothetical protein